MQELRKMCSGIGWGYLIYLLASGAAQVLLGMILGTMGVLGNEQMQWLMIPLSSAAMYCVGFPVFLWYMKRVPIPEMENGRRNQQAKLSAKEFFFLLLAAAALMYLGNIIGNSLSAVFNLFLQEPMINHLDDAIQMGSVWLNLFLVILVAPAVEEYLFRKALLDRMMVFGDGMAILMSGLLFAVFHGNFFQFFYAALVGCLLAWVYIQTGSLKYCYLLHGALNFFGSGIPVMLAGIMEILPGIWPELFTAFYLMVDFFLMIWGVVIIAFHLKKMKASLCPGILKLSPKKKFSLILLAPGMLVFVAWNLLAMFL